MSDQAVARPAAVVCPLCGSDDVRFAFAKDGFAHHSCGECSALFVWPMPSAAGLSPVYATGCWSGSRTHFAATWSWALRRLEASGGGPLLDVGCAGGDFLAHARQRGWTDLAGVELSAEAARAARTASGAEVRCADLLDAAWPAGHFAAVTLWDVLEHHPRPRDLMREVHRVVRPGGSVVVSTVHSGGLALRLLRARSVSVRPPEHLTFYRRRTLRRLLEAEGLRVQRARCLDVFIQDWVRLLGGPRTTAPLAQRAAYQRWYRRLTSSPLLTPARAAANLVLDVTGLGDELVALARRPA